MTGMLPQGGPRIGLRVGVVATGEMGSAIGAALSAAGVVVTTTLAGRSAGSAARAHAAGFAVADSDDDLVAGCDLLLSVVPPSAACTLAERFAPALARASHKPVYVDCNAVAPQTVAAVQRVIEAAGCGFVDAGLFGGPTSGKPGVVVYASGPRATVLGPLDGRGITVRCMDGPVGAASALKLSFAGLNKGFTALGAFMLLAATRSCSAEALIEQLQESQPGILAYVTRFLPAMFPKAHRWAPEMEEIAGFLGDDPDAQQVFTAFARLYRRLAQDVAAGESSDIAALRAFCEAGKANPGIAA